MAERKLKYRFFDPNPEGETADYLLKLLIEKYAGSAAAEIRTYGQDQPEKMVSQSPV